MTRSIYVMATAAASAITAQRAVMLSTLIGLLAVTGMRVGEALRLTDADIDTDAAVITIRETKFGKSRQVPVTASTIDALPRAWTAIRDRTIPTLALFDACSSPAPGPRSPTPTSVSPSDGPSTTAGIGDPAPVLRPTDP